MKLWNGLMITTALTGLALGTASAGELEDMLDKIFEARGGRDKVEAIETIRMSGNMGSGGGTTSDAPFVMEWKKPDRIRLEFILQGMKGVQAYDGVNGWWIMPFMGKTVPEQMTADLTRSIAETADMFPLIDYADKGHELEFHGEESIAGVRALKIKLTRKNREVSYLYFDEKTHLQIMQMDIRGFGTEDLKISTSFDGYREVDGVMLAHSTTITAPTSTQTITVDKIEINVELADTRFNMPEEEPAPPGE